MEINTQNQFDIVIVGAGAVGCAIARELSRYQLKIAVFEKESDVAAGTSGRNSAVVHAGFNNKPGSLMAKFCVEGNEGFESLCRELDVPYKKTGKLIVAFDESDFAGIDKLIENGKKNGVKGLEFVGEDVVKKLEPHVGGVGAMLSPNTAITNPFLYTVALAENAAQNGAKFFLETEVKGISKRNNLFRIKAGETYYYSRYVINSAGLYSDRIASMAGETGYKIYPCRGEYFILDKRTSQYLNMPVYPVPRPGIGGLGVHLTPTMEGNILIGPSAEYIKTKNDYSATKTVMDKLFKEAKELLPPLSMKHIIRSYTGIRSKIVGPKTGGFGDFVIEESKVVPNLINLIGIESPGLTSSAPISRMVRDIIANKEDLISKKDFTAERKGIVQFRELPEEQKETLIKECPEYGEIVCRCEGITKKEILDAVNNPLGVTTLAGIKYRARAMMGRCQGGYCLTRIVDILKNEKGLNPEEITLRGKNSKLFTGQVK
ncbi:FAD dependent oxidoreductase [Ruminiclostridium papyrosolvens DSM 2782]|uniref:FAD dependent oxidoreductase n=1 Tax=Ruminiclostridium papyrosolvens DSM 2782 TaxID=588581 RepID=F1TAB6_9FIRM|nr:NAD(P)/FAD-dependent oxidoreductase [Ruminiclostridium papyrosolvens]EGD48459.1 FAD dependent oxidoreductase [Ruminiclostridium papyrosolvens DSM 2782]WES32783.1 NAD(P)/FAD-dependent oxidoreductase [Ruminiclostridium papyrosolvens DSM 2782]